MMQHGAAVEMHASKRVMVDDDNDAAW